MADSGRRDAAQLPFSDDELERYARHIVLREVGGAGQAKLKAARVAVVGAGGISSPALSYLVGGGVGAIDIFDDDTVSSSNLQRQILFAEDDNGQAKVDAARVRLHALNRHVAVTGHRVRLTRDNAADLLAGADVVLDGTDSFASRLAVADAAHALRIPLVSAAVGPFAGQLAVYRGWMPTLPCYRCFVGDIADRDGDDCAAQGILGAVTGIIGSLAALEVMRAIVGFGDDPAGKLLIFDALSLRFRTVTVPKDPRCRCAA